LITTVARFPLLLPPLFPLPLLPQLLPVSAGVVGSSRSGGSAVVDGLPSFDGASVSDALLSVESVASAFSFSEVASASATSISTLASVVTATVWSLASPALAMASEL
jgi:hypothetical protein